MNILKDFVKMIKIQNGCFDEPDIEGSFYIKDEEWMGKIFLHSNEYRIITYKNKIFNKYGLQAKIDKRWVDVIVHDSGCCSEGKTRPAKWIKLSDIASFSIGSLKEIINKILGLPEEIEILNI